MSNTLKLGNGKWATGKDTVLAYNDLNSNYKPLAFSFSRASSGTVVNKDGLIETVGSGEPRIDFKDNTKGALKLEPSRTNLITYSEDLSNWTKLFGHTYPVTDNSTDVISPSGLNDASKVEFDNSSQGIALFPSLNGTYSGFVYVKGIAGETIRFNFGGQEQNYTLTGEWDKLERENLSLSVNAFNLNTFGGATARTIYVWGAQIEQGSYATSYIPTSGSAVTRSVDFCNNGANEQVINSTEGVLYIETKGLVDVPINSGHFKLSRSGEVSFNNSLTIQHRNNGYLRVWVNGTATADIHFNVNIDFTENHKIAVLYKLNGYKLFIDGVSQSLFGTPTQTVFSGLDNLSFDNRGTGNWNGSIKDVRVYNTALTDQELQALTTI